MSAVFVDVSISLDGFLAGVNRGPGNPLGDGGVRIHEWLFATRTFQRLVTGAGAGEPGADDDLVHAVIARAGAHVMGRRMFDEGEAGWPEEAPFHAPVFVVTRNAREPWVRPGGTTFHFVTDGLQAALQRARDAAGGKDVRVCGGADTIQQALAEGEVDELVLHVVPRLLVQGLRLFEGLLPEQLSLEPVGSSCSTAVHHLHYRVRR